MATMKNVADKICEMIYSKERRRPEPYDTTAEVRRVENGKAYVHLPGGIDETPVALTIDAAPGDTVQVRVADGAAWLVGNRTAPPTDDTTARRAQRTATEADKTATMAQTTADEAQETADKIRQHFWTDDDGAHITEVTQEEYEADPTAAGGNLLARSDGVAVRKGTKELATMTKDGFDAKTYDSGDNEVVIAHLGYGPGVDSHGTIAKAPYYTVGKRRATSITIDGITYQPNIGNWSVAFGYGNIASAYSALVTGQNNVSNGGGSFVGGNYSVSNGKNNIVFGEEVSAGSVCRDTAIFGYHTKYSSSYGLVAGKYNVDNSDSLFEIGNGANGASSNAFEVKETGDAIVSGNLTASNIGAKNWVAPSAVSCQSGKWYKVAEVELDPGIWFIDCNAYFPSTNTTGARQIRVTTATFTDGTTTAPGAYGSIGIDVQMGANTAQYPQAHFPVDISSRTTFRLAAYQGSGSTMSVTGRMYATRIK